MLVETSMLAIYRRHQTPCPHKSRRFRRCNCPIWVQGSLGSEYVRRTLDLRSWEAASDLVHAWESSGRVGVEKREAPTIAEAVDQYLADAKATGLAMSQSLWRTVIARLDHGQFVPEDVSLDAEFLVGDEPGGAQHDQFVELLLRPHCRFTSGRLDGAMCLQFVSG